VGLMMGASHRVVTDTTRFAMPEISIGLFPDVAGTWMLSRLPDGIGLFLALTGAQLGASGCQLLGLADFVVDAARSEDVLRSVRRAGCSTGRVHNDAVQSELLLKHRPKTPLASGPLQAQHASTREHCNSSDLHPVGRAIAASADHEDPW